MADGSGPTGRRPVASRAGGNPTRPVDDLVPRSAADQLRQHAADFRAVIVNGPRQSGKTTLLDLFHRDHGGTYRSLDDVEQLTAAQADPASFAQTGDRPLIIDEVQRGGDPLVLAIKRALDLDRSPGQFILSGSSRFLTMPTLSESLAGRAVFVDLWPLSLPERTGQPGPLFDQLFSGPEALVGQSSDWRRDDYLAVICAGGFPEVLQTRSESARRTWFNGYLRTVLARDIGSFAEVQHARAVPRLLALIAARAGGLFVQSDLARSLAVSHDTVRVYTSYLETVFLAAGVPAWSTNATSRFVKTPKVFLTDSGLAAHLLGVSPAALLPGHQALGGLVETFVLSELVKLRSLTTDAFEIYHYRDRDDREIDFICETPDQLIVAIEVKATASPRPEHAHTLRWLRDKLGDRLVAGLVLHLGEQAHRYGDRLLSLPVSALWGHASLPR